MTVLLSHLISRRARITCFAGQRLPWDHAAGQADLGLKLRAVVCKVSQAESRGGVVETQIPGSRPDLSDQAF